MVLEQNPNVLCPFCRRPIDDNNADAEYTMVSRPLDPPITRFTQTSITAGTSLSKVLEGIDSLVALARQKRPVPTRTMMHVNRKRYVKIGTGKRVSTGESSVISVIVVYQ